jgi:hypothetical protein
MKLVIRFFVLLALCSVLPCVAEEPAAVETQATRVIWRGELERVRDAAPDTNVCHTVDVSRVKSSAMALDEMTGLELTGQIDWHDVPLDTAEVQRAVDQWRKWFECNGNHLVLSRVVAAVEKSVKWLAKQHEVP